MVANPEEIHFPYHTLEEYFAIEGAGHARYEYWDGEIVCMSGGTQQHMRIGGNTYFTLRQQLTGRNCEAFTNELPIKTPALPPYRYPDASVACGKAVFEKIESVDTLVNPTLIVEVLSPTTTNRDRGPKRVAYQALPSLREYLLIAQDAPHVTHYLLQGTEWLRSDYGSLDVTITLPSIECVLALSDVYQGVGFG
jgi:Uma2 family endonuclease